MTLPRIPEYFKDYKITAVGKGRTILEAEYNLKIDMEYHKRWIRGKLIREERWGDGANTKGSEISRYCDLTWRKAKYIPGSMD